VPSVDPPGLLTWDLDGQLDPTCPDITCKPVGLGPFLLWFRTIGSDPITQCLYPFGRTLTITQTGWVHSCCPQLSPLGLHYRQPFTPLPPRPPPPPHLPGPVVPGPRTDPLGPSHPAWPRTLGWTDLIYPVALYRHAVPRPQACPSSVLQALDPGPHGLGPGPLSKP